MFRFLKYLPSMLGLVLTCSPPQTGWHWPGLIFVLAQAQEPMCAIPENNSDACNGVECDQACPLTHASMAG